MRIKVQFFAVLKEKVGVERLSLELEEGATLNDLKEKLIKKYRKKLNLDKSIVFAVNGAIVRDNQKLKNNDKVVLLPPVSGGKDG